MAKVMIPLIVIVGETASGKSDMAVQLAKRCKGEIICADSRTIYKGMDIGTATPSLADQDGVPHHLLNIINPDELYSAAQFKADATSLIHAIAARGNVPIMVGGSGLYIDSVLFDYQFGTVDHTKREHLNMMSLEELQEQARELSIAETEVNFKNRRHLQRAVESGKVLKKEQQLRPNTLVIGIKTDKDKLEHRINSRTQDMFNQGLVNEVKILGQKYGWDNKIILGTSYQWIVQLIRGEISLEEAKAQFVQSDLHLAKKQRTWFRRNKNIQWITDFNGAEPLVKTFLSHSEHTI